jgi:signal transduction histidine kinase
MAPSINANSLAATTLCAFQEAREAFFVFEPQDQRILEANAAAARLTGLTVEQLRAQRFTEFFTADVAEAAASAEAHILIQTARGPERVRVRLRIRPFVADGETVALAIVETPDSEQRKAERVQAELAKVKEELVRQTRLATLGQMSASVAHDLRNPLGAIRNATYFLSRKVPPTEPKWAEYLDLIDREVVICDQIITNMLELTRSKEAAPAILDLGQLVRKAFQSAKPPGGVHFHFRAAAEPILVRADPLQLRQVFDNLLKNSLDALAGGGEIWVEAATDGGSSIILMSDSGPGVAPELRDRLFEPLFSTKAKGTGLGLWICRQVVERHGGHIEHVEVPGRGFALRFSLPR